MSGIRFKFLILMLCAPMMVGAQVVDGADGSVPDDSLLHSEEVAGVDNSNIFIANMPQEKVYLHFDNTGYFIGETIRFKAYVMRSDVGGLTDMSRVLYVELLNPGGDVIATRKCAIIDGQAVGDIKLEKVLGSGFYEVRAFTRYMTNWGTAACFSRVFPIFNEPKTEGDYSKMVIDRVSHKKRLPNYRQNVAGAASVTGQRAEGKDVFSAGKTQVTFYPEGGYSVVGLETNVAFQLWGEGADTADVNCQLVDAEGQIVVDDIKTVADGRGVFRYTPDGRALSLKVTDGKGRSKLHPVPNAFDEGLSLSVNTLAGKNIIASVGGSASLQGATLGIMLQHEGAVIATDKVTIAEEPQQLVFPREQMPGGVSLLTVFDASGAVLADRMIFVAPPTDASDSIKVVAKTEGLRPCGKVELELTALPNATFSFSAMDAATMPNGKEGNAKTWMLLSSELRGYIAHPDYYFEADDTEHRRAADLLMMVQGWRKYGVPKAKKLQPVEDKLYLFGQLKSVRKKNTVSNVDLSVFLYNRGGESLKGETRTDSLGYYQFELPDCNGDWNMLMYTKKEDKDVKYYVGIDRHFSPSPKSVMLQEQDLISVNKPNLFIKPEEYIEDDVFVPLNKRVKVLPTVKVKGKRIYDGARDAWETETIGEHNAQLYYNCDLESDKISDQGQIVPGFYEWLQRRNPLFGGNTLDMERTIIEKTEDTGTEDIEGADDIIEAGVITDEEEILEGLTYKNRPIVWILNNNFHMITGTQGRTISITYAQYKSKSDRMPVFLDEVKSIYVRDDNTAVKNYVVSADLMGMNPVMVFVYTHHTMFRNVKGLRRTHYQGYHQAEQFQMEDYSILPPMEDFRRTIFWEPNVKTDKDGKAKVEFYNNSSCTEMYISAEGITPDGRYLINE